MVDNFTYEGRDLEALSVLSNYRDWIVSAFRPYLRGATAEIGAGIGTFSQSLMDSGVERLELIEPSADLTRRLTEKFSDSPGCTIIGKTLEDYLADASRESLDCVVMVNVLEHIMDDTQALKSLFQTLKPGGHLLVFVPALPWLFSKLDAEHGHHRRYYKREFVDLVQKSNFKIISARYFDLLGILPWWLMCTVGGKTGFSPSLSRLYDCVGVPFGRSLEGLFSPPLGKNILLIAEKTKEGAA